MQEFLLLDEWKIIEQGFDPQRHTKCESIFSIGNGKMGQRANFEETYSGESLQGAYIAGIYYPDKTRVGWWKNGYPEYFAKVINSPCWTALKIFINGEELDISHCNVHDFQRILDMKRGILSRTFQVSMKNGTSLSVHATRFLSMTQDEIGAMQYSITPTNKPAKIVIHSLINANVRNHDAHYDEDFWIHVANYDGGLTAKTKKSDFYVSLAMKNDIIFNKPVQNVAKEKKNAEKTAEEIFTLNVPRNETASIQKIVSVVSSLNYHPETIHLHAQQSLAHALSKGYHNLLKDHIDAWKNKWEQSDIIINGDIRSQQAIRFNIFQLNQTYTGADSRLNVGPKGFTGEKYGGGTYWDTEAYCIPFYLSTAKEKVSRQLLEYRYNQLPKAIENAKKLGISNGAALFPMVTMNGEECHNEWEITFEEIHRNGAIVFAIFNYTRYTGDETFLLNHGMEVLIGVARFWKQRVHYSERKKMFVIMGVTGPNEYENNVDNNWYTNFLAKWCLNYAIEQINHAKTNHNELWKGIKAKTNFQDYEINEWNHVAQNIFLPECKEKNIFLQQENFLDKELIPVSRLNPNERPINQHWSWDKILRSVYIKQADVLQGLFFFEDRFDLDTIRRNYEFYEQFTVHESSLSPCIYSIIASKIGKPDEAYKLYLRTSRLDLDDYNKEAHEGLHITSMAGTWMSVVYGFGGLRVKNDILELHPRLPKEWEAISFKIYFRGAVFHVVIGKERTTVRNIGELKASISVNDVINTLNPGDKSEIHS